MTGKEAARALAEIISDLETESVLVSGIEYVLTLNTGETHYGSEGGEMAFAYDLGDIEKFVTGRKSSDYSDFCSAVSPVEDRDIAIAIAARSSQRLTRSGVCVGVLSDEAYSLVRSAVLEKEEREGNALLRSHGYKPETVWRKNINDGCSVVCTRGEALKNIELEEAARKKAR